MYLDITDLLTDFEPRYYSASVAELGQDAGAITWQNAVDRAETVNLLDTEEKVDAFKAFISGFGAWTEEEINAHTSVELGALLLQFIAGDVREQNTDRICPTTESVDGRAYYDIGE